MSEIEWSDRYGGRVPSKLRACYWCEAMGCYPEPDARSIAADGMIALDSPFEWDFVTCPECNGSARVSWYVTVARFPKWLVEGVPFVWRYGVRREFDPAKSRVASMREALWAAYGADLGLSQP